ELPNYSTYTTIVFGQSPPCKDIANSLQEDAEVLARSWSFPCKDFAECVLCLVNEKSAIERKKQGNNSWKTGIFSLSLQKVSNDAPNVKHASAPI
ncbi:MAG: hypothetical protein MJZ29_12665, partial [Bacteroidaceae bacterium]|nr:hypothetical protein [Bacteroidaceae bacterium]